MRLVVLGRDPICSTFAQIVYSKLSNQVNLNKHWHRILFSFFQSFTNFLSNPTSLYLFAEWKTLCASCVFNCLVDKVVNVVCPQFFIVLLVILLAELILLILFFVYTDKVGRLNHLIYSKAPGWKNGELLNALGAPAACPSLTGLTSNEKEFMIPAWFLHSCTFYSLSKMLYVVLFKKV